MADRRIRIGCGSAAWGDSIHNMRQLVDRGQVDFLVGDYLAEVTMAILARQKARDPATGFVPDWIAAIEPLLPEIKRQGIRLITNAGGLSPGGCRARFVAAAQTRGLSFRVAVVSGDDLMPRRAEIEADPGISIPGKLASMNAYLGARPIAEALDAGAEVVITGRVVDSALALGPLVHGFGWSWDDFDRLSAGSLAGHIIECGAQATGGLFTDWAEVADGWPDMGMPIVSCADDGSFVVEKPMGTGGLVSIGSVAEQIVYEIGDPARYLLPDVACDWRAVRLDQIAPDRVSVSGAVGLPPPESYKVCATSADGWRVLTSFMIAGGDAAVRGARAAEALVARCTRLLAEAGFDPFDGVSIEPVGSDTSAVIKIGVSHVDPRALDIFAREFAVPAVSMAQGITGLFSGRPTPSPTLKVTSFAWPKDRIETRMDIDEGQ